VNENYAFVVTCFSISILKNRFEYRSDFDADTEIVTDLRNNIHDCITRQRKFDALGRCIHLFERNVGIDREKRIHSGIRSESIADIKQ